VQPLCLSGAGANQIQATVASCNDAKTSQMLVAPLWNLPAGYKTGQYFKGGLDIPAPVPPTPVSRDGAPGCAGTRPARSARARSRRHRWVAGHPVPLLIAQGSNDDIIDHGRKEPRDTGEPIGQVIQPRPPRDLDTQRGSQESPSLDRCGSLLLRLKSEIPKRRGRVFALVEARVAPAVQALPRPVASGRDLTVGAGRPGDVYCVLDRAVKSRTLFSDRTRNRFVERRIHKRVLGHDIIRGRLSAAMTWRRKN
jgi:hypothetical protein